MMIQYHNQTVSTTRAGRSMSQRRISAYVTALLAGLCCLLVSAPVQAQLGTVAPVEKRQFLDDSGDPLASGKVYYYQCGTTTDLEVYQDSALSTPHAQPIVLDAGGRATIYLTPGVCHKVQVNDSDDANVYTEDDVGPGHGVGNDRLRLSPHAATLASGAFTATFSQYEVDTQGAAASDDLDTITAGTGVGEGFLLVLTPANVSRVVTAKHSTGNLELGAGDYRLDHAGASLTLYYDGSNWVELARAGGGGWTVVTTTATGSQDDFDPGIVGNTIIRANNASALTITGFAAGVAGQQIIVQCLNADVDTDHTPSASAAANELINIATSGNTPCSTRGFLHYIYDGTTAMWRLTAHDQGAVIEIAHSAGNFTGNDSMTWDVESGDQLTYAYRLQGRELTVWISIDASTVGGTPSSRLQVAIPGGFTAADRAQEGAYVAEDNNVRLISFYQVLASGTTLDFFAATDTSDWTASANTEVRATVAIEVD